MFAANIPSVHYSHPGAARDKTKQKQPLTFDLRWSDSHRAKGRLGQNTISTFTSSLRTHIHQGPISGKTTEKNEFYIMTREGKKKGSWTCYN